MMTVYPKIAGGLGNQLFEYAMARAHSLRTGARLVLNLDDLADDSFFKRKYSLDRFNVNVPTVEHSPRVRNLLAWKRGLLYRLLQAHVCEEPRKGRNSLPKRWIGKLWLNGYWQSESYFEDCADRIYEDLRLGEMDAIRRTPVARSILGFPDSCFIHFRSYFDASGKGNTEMALPLDYYRNAMRHVVAHTATTPHFFLFSDEPDFAESHLRPIAEACGAQLTVVRECDIASPFTDFALMRLCRHAIVGNSTFSWWAAWLGEQDHFRQNLPGMVIRAEGVPFATANAAFYPKRWIKVPRSAQARSEYDLIVPIGMDGSVAMQLRHRGLRKFALPFDWTLMRDENSLVALAEAFSTRCTNLCRKENLEETTGITSFAYLDRSSGIRFMGYFDDDIRKPGVYEKGAAKFRRRVDRLYAKMESARSVLFLGALTSPVRDETLTALMDSVRKAFPNRDIDFRFLQFGADRLPVKSTLSSVTNIGRDESVYDTRHTSCEWAFLDNLRQQRPRLRGLRKKLFILSRTLAKPFLKEGRGSVEDLI